MMEASKSAEAIAAEVRERIAELTPRVTRDAAELVLLIEILPRLEEGEQGDVDAPRRLFAAWRALADPSAGIATIPLAVELPKADSGRGSRRERP